MDGPTDPPTDYLLYLIVKIRLVGPKTGLTGPVVLQIRYNWPRGSSDWHTGPADWATISGKLDFHYFILLTSMNVPGISLLIFTTEKRGEKDGKQEWLETKLKIFTVHARIALPHV